MPQAIIPSSGLWKLLVPDTAIDGGIANPSLTLPTGTYKTLWMRAKYRDTVGASFSVNYLVMPYASGGTCKFNASLQNGIVRTENSDGGTTPGNPPASTLLGTGAKAGNFTISDILVYDCDDVTGNKLCIIRTWCAVNDATAPRFEQHELQLLPAAPTTVFQLLGAAAPRMIAGSTWKVYQAE